MGAINSPISVMDSPREKRLRICRHSSSTSFGDIGFTRWTLEDCKELRVVWRNFNSFPDGDEALVFASSKLRLGKITMFSFIGTSFPPGAAGRTRVRAVALKPDSLRKMLGAAHNPYA